MSIYEKIFGKVKSGSGYESSCNVDGSYNTQSLRSSMQKFRNAIYSGAAAKNLSHENAELIISVIEPHLKALPIGKKISYSTKNAIRLKLWGYVKSGKLSPEDFADAKEILALF